MSAEDVTHGPWVQLKSGKPLDLLTLTVVGSAADNARDRDQKGRARHGEGPRPKTRGSGNHAAKLTQRDVDRIRDMAMVGARQRDIAKRFGVSQSQVGNIVRGKCWAT